MAQPGSDRVLAGLRAGMAAAAIDALLIPSEDPHQSEYRADCHKRREFVTGFTGSAGTALVTSTQALLWTDGRYFDQAARQLSPAWTLMRQGQHDTPTIPQWLRANLDGQSILGLDPSVTSLGSYRGFLQLPIGHLCETTPNLVDGAWGADRPPMPNAPVMLLPIQYAGMPSTQKIQQVQDVLSDEGADAFVVCALDEIAWLLNLRGRDIQYNPVFFAFAVIATDSVTLYVEESKLPDKVRTYLDSVGVIRRPYDAILPDLKLRSGQVVCLDPNQSSMAVYLALGDCRVVERASPLEQLKAVKNAAELDGFRRCHVRDGVALVRYLFWLEKELEHGGRVSEVEAADRLEKFRAEQELFQGLSFNTISGAGPNSAIVHYDPAEGENRILDQDGVYLVDSGGQYLDGTTDVTRTVHAGRPTPHQIDCFTRVLIGHIRLARAVFPVGTTGHQLDVLAREALWAAGLNYNHGTGHGIGSHLCVHEGPHGISALLRRMAVATVALKPGMTVTNEPGYYESDNFGIRIENVMLVKNVATKHDFGGATWMGFETVTMVPIQKSLINVGLLSESELTWLDDYHGQCLTSLTPLLSRQDPDALRWLQHACSPLSA